MKSHQMMIISLFVVFAFNFQESFAQDGDYTKWPYAYKDRMEKILNLTSEIEKWDPASGPLFDAPDNFYWLQIVTNYNKKKDELISNYYDDYPKGEAADPITKITFAAIDKLEKLIIKKGGPGKLYEVSESAKTWTKDIEEVSRQIDAWDGVKALSFEQIEFTKAAIDKKERELWMDTGSRRNDIGFHYPMVYDAFNKLARIVEKKGGKSILEPKPQMNSTLQFVLDEITETTKTVNEFDPKTKIWTARNDLIWKAVSPGDRAKWAADFFKTFENEKPVFYKALDNLAAAFAKKVSFLTPTDNMFVNHNPAEEALMKKQIGVKTIYKIGIKDPNWSITKNNLDIPLRRFKQAYVWGDAADDSKYCRLYQINLIQEYEGGGKYGATFAKYVDSWPRTCIGK